ncbi:hypothetical protein K474DRAFT_726136 [Panus rudis PR-1116 ss-1]|nr:hypothetical protein K474DRAFT_726136 [Panus rudis PR-1116 ss-1]
MGKSLDGRIVGPMPHLIFLKEVMEPSGGQPKLKRVSRRTFENVSNVLTNPAQFPTRFAQAVNDSGFCPNFALSQRSEEIDVVSKTKIRPGLCLFPRDPPEGHEHASNWATMEFLVDIQPGDHMDPFRHLFKQSAYSLRGDNEKSSEQRLQQLYTYFTAQFARQHRIFTFALCVFGRYVRFLRVDRSGLIVSDAVNYIANPRILAEFLWRYNHLPDGMRGFDPHAVPATSAERRVLKKAILEYIESTGSERSRRFPKMRTTLSSDYPAYHVSVRDEHSEDVQHYIIRKPFSGGRSLFGRCTRGYVAFRLGHDRVEDIADGQSLSERLVFLKDSWRMSEDGMEKEADIYEDLKDHGVSFIPSVLCAGDVFYNGSVQRTFTERWIAGLPPEWEHLAEDISRIYIHHRVVQELAFPLNTVTDAKELVQVVRDAVQSLIEAYTRAGRLHRDVSERNVMISRLRRRPSRGVLNDWDVSHALKEDEVVSTSKAGTWPFMSVNLLSGPSRTNGFYDDLESILWVLLYVAIHHFKHSGDSHLEMFDERRELDSRDSSPRIVGGGEKLCFIGGYRDITFKCPALDDLVSKLCRFWNKFYYDRSRDRPREHPAALLRLFDQAIARSHRAWHDGEWVDDQYPKPRRGNSELSSSDVAISDGSSNSHVPQGDRRWTPTKNPQNEAYTLTKRPAKRPAEDVSEPSQARSRKRAR